MPSFCFILILTLLPSIVLGQEVQFPDFATPEVVTPNHNLSVGNSDLAGFHDGEAVFINPASIAKKLSRFDQKRHRVSFELTSQTNSSLFNKAYGGNFLTGPSTQFKFLNLTKLHSELISDRGGALYNEISSNLYYKYKRFMVGLAYNNKSFAALENLSEVFYGRKRKDVGPYVSFSARMGRRFDFGLTYMYLTRKEIYTVREQDSSGVQTAIDDQTFEGATNQLTLGLRYRSKSSYSNPGWIFSLVGRNFFSDTFHYRGGDTVFDRIPNTFDLGASRTYGRSGTRYKLSFAIRDITSEYDVKIGQKVQSGLNMQFARYFDVGIGFFDQSPTFGFKLKTKRHGALLFTTYSTTMNVAKQNIADRRFILQYSRLWGF